MIGYGYWTGTSAFGSMALGWGVNYGGSLRTGNIASVDVIYGGFGVRPVIEVLKSKL